MKGRDWIAKALWVLAAATGANALWMLLKPSTWYSDLPAAVADFGPYNEHFVRDVGCAFATVALALGWAAWRPALRPALVGLSAFFLIAHALLHVFDTLRGAVDAGHWAIDFPGVYLPAAVTLWLALKSRDLRALPQPPTDRWI